MKKLLRHLGRAAVLRRADFNMIEVALGLGILTWGALVVTELLPASLALTAHSSSASYAADRAEQFVSLYMARLANSDGSTEAWADLCQSLPQSKPGECEPTEWRQWLLVDGTAISYGGQANQYFKLEQKSETLGTQDFSAIYRMWRTPVNYCHLQDGEWTQTAPDLQYGVAINIEISWPVSAPYKHRHKELYIREVYP